MTEKQIALSNLTRKQRKERRRVLLVRRDKEVLASVGLALAEDVAGFKRPGPLANPLPLV